MDAVVKYFPYRKNIYTIAVYFMFERAGEGYEDLVCFSTNVIMRSNIDMPIGQTYYTIYMDFIE